MTLHERKANERTNRTKGSGSHSARIFFLKSTVAHAFRLFIVLLQNGTSEFRSPYASIRRACRALRVPMHPGGMWKMLSQLANKVLYGFKPYKRNRQ